MNSRLVVSDPSFKKIAELLPKAAEQMVAAEKKLQGQSPDGALPPENLALQFLQQAEEEFELQVQTGRQAGGGGGGGGAGSIANDLADLFKLEMDKMANQYETNSQASTQQQDQQIDELAEKLKELARRQEQEIERQRRLAAGQSVGGNPASASDLTQLVTFLDIPAKSSCHRCLVSPCSAAWKTTMVYRDVLESGRRPVRRPPGPVGCVADADDRWRRFAIYPGAAAAAAWPAADGSPFAAARRIASAALRNWRAVSARSWRCCSRDSFSS